MELVLLDTAIVVGRIQDGIYGWDAIRLIGPSAPHKIILEYGA